MAMKWCIACSRKVNADKRKYSLIGLFLSYRVKSEIDQFVRGLNDVGGLWETIKTHPAEFESLFTRRPVALTSAVFQSLLFIEWSEIGSNRRSQEDATIYCWELFLQSVEGNMEKFIKVYYCMLVI